MRNDNSGSQENADTGAARASIDDSLRESVLWICDHHGLGRSAEALTSGLPRGRMLSPSIALAALKNAGMTGGLVERPLAQLPDALAPFILLRKDHGGAIYLGREPGRAPYNYRVLLPETGSVPAVLDEKDLGALYGGYAILVKPQAVIDERAGEETPQHAGHWLTSTLWRYRRYYFSAALAALLVNVLSLAGIFFTMNVYDRVVPNQAYVTLWSLAIGVVIALAFETLTRFVRARLLDVAGRKADLVMGSVLFRQAMSIRMEYRPPSSGAFANQLREFESVRDFATSASLGAISDLPFVLLFVGVIFLVGGPLGWIPVLLVPLIVLMSVLVQWPLARTMRENLRESSLKQGVLIEAVEGLETLKAVAGEGHMQRRWETFSALAAATSMKSRQLSMVATNLVQSLQQLQTVALVVFGVYLIGDGTITQGALIATVMLSGRATAPLGQVAALAVRYQQAKAALTSLNKLMRMPVDRDPSRGYLSRPALSGQLSLKEVEFSYPQTSPQKPPTVLSGVSLDIAPGERVAILGRVGSGKSTLLRLMARLYQPVSGQLFVDGLDVAQIDPADWHRVVGYVGQEARLFYGTLRENVMIGRPDATSEDLLRVLRVTGLDQIAASHPSGINLPIGEDGHGLSGGQRQLVSLARSLLAQPQMLLLDEPTSAMDAQTEGQFLQHLAQASEGHTLVVVTHRPSVLALVDRIIVVDSGKVVADGPKGTVLERLAANTPPAEKALP